MMNGPEKSDSVIVALKPTNTNGAIRGGVGGAKGRDRGECGPMKHILDSVPAKRVTGVGSHTAMFRRRYPRWEPYAGKPHVRIWAGGAR